MSLIKTPLRYPGGKSRIAELLVDLMPDFGEYREPFLGGGSVFLTAKQKRPRAAYWVNDLYYDLYCFWSEAQLDIDGLVGDIKRIRKEFDGRGRELHDILVKDIHNYGIHDKAVAFFSINRSTFSGTTGAA